MRAESNPQNQIILENQILLESKLTQLYRVTHHLDSYILLTSKQKFLRLVGRYCSYILPTQALSTFNLMSTEYRNQGDVSPCIIISLNRQLCK